MPHHRLTFFCRRLFVLAVAMALAPTPALADGVSANVALVFDTVSARHAIDGRPETFVAPLPFFSGEVKYRRVSLDAQALSTFGTLDFDDQKTGLGISTYSARYALFRNIYAGAGITALNQTTDFPPHQFDRYFTDLGLTERSHLSGVRYELGATRRRMQLDLGFTPAIHGTVFDHCVTLLNGARAGACVDEGLYRFSSTEPEVSSEFDAAYRYFIPVGKGFDAVAGLRYVNFIGRISYPYHVSTDQNRGAPLLSFGLRYHIR